MKIALIPTCLLLAVGLALAAAATPARADDAYVATTTADADVPVDWLELALKPKTKSELAVETAAWRDLLRAQVAEISTAEIAEKRGEAQEGLPLLRTQRDGLIRRLQAVMTAYESKGGDAAEYVAYVDAVSGSALENLDVKSPNKLLTAATGWLKSPEGGLHWLRAIILFFVVLILARIVSNILGRIVGKAVSRWKNASELLKKFFVNTVKNLVFLIGIVVALSMLGVNVGPFVAAIGAVGFIIGFALQGTLSNFASGLMILLYRPYDIGEVVTVSGVTGKVEHMSLVSTSILTPDNQTVIVPNGSIWGNVITNITGRDTRRVDLTFGIGYGDDMAKAQGIMEKILANHPKILAEPAPVIKVHELADSSVNFIVRPWAKTSDYWDVYWDVTRAVKERFDAEGISIPFPQQEVTMRQVT
jgi:small conductance mechanosensitive channel